MTSLLSRVRPETAAGGIARDNGGVHFYVQVNAMLRPHMTVLDYGAGRGGAFVDGDASYWESLAKIQGKVRKVVGVDVDNAIFEHPFLDEKLLIDTNINTIPVKDQSIDLILAHWVFEHIENPSQVADEFFRNIETGRADFCPDSRTVGVTSAFPLAWPRKNFRTRFFVGSIRHLKR